MRRSSISSDRGSASLEFLTVGIILLVPLVYLVLALAAIQAGALGVEGAARQAARVAVIAADRGERDADSVAVRWSRALIAHFRARLTRDESGSTLLLTIFYCFLGLSIV